jgi:hypothetical protein
VKSLSRDAGEKKFIVGGDSVDVIFVDQFTLLMTSAKLNDRDECREITNKLGLLSG